MNYGSSRREGTSRPLPIINLCFSHVFYKISRYPPWKLGYSTSYSYRLRSLIDHPLICKMARYLPTRKRRYTQHARTHSVSMKRAFQQEWSNQRNVELNKKSTQYDPRLALSSTILLHKQYQLAIVSTIQVYFSTETPALLRPMISQRPAGSRSGCATPS